MGAEHARSYTSKPEKDARDFQQRNQGRPTEIESQKKKAVPLRKIPLYELVTNNNLREFYRKILKEPLLSYKDSKNTFITDIDSVCDKVILDTGSDPFDHKTGEEYSQTLGKANGLMISRNRQQKVKYVFVTLED